MKYLLSILGVSLSIMAQDIEWGDKIRCRFIDPVNAIERSFGPERINITGTVENGLAELIYTQYFINPHDSLLNLEYHFPLPPNASVHEFIYESEEEIFTTQLMKKEDAQQLYDSLQNTGHQAALLSQVRPNIFAQSMANIPALAEIKVTIRLSYPIEYADGEYHLSFPTYIAPRFPSGGIGVPSNNLGYNPTDSVTPGQLSIDLLLRDRFPLSSPTHTFLTQTTTQGTRVFTGEEGDKPNRDVVAKIKIPEAQQVMNLSSYFKEGDSSGYFNLKFLPPNFLLTPNKQIEAVFLIDRSGSQFGWPLDYQKAISKKILNMLSSNTQIQVMAFDDRTEYAFSKPVLANSEALQKATQFIDGIYARGGTQLYDAVRKMLDIPLSYGYTRVYFLLTDGFITDESRIFDLMSKHPTEPRLITFGMGNNTNAYFLQTAAEIGNGVSYTVTEQENLDVIANSAFQKASYNTLRIDDLDLADAQGYDFTSTLPKVIGEGAQFSLFGKYRQGGKHKVCTTVYADPDYYQFCKYFTFASADTLMGSLPKNWAKQIIKNLEWQVQTPAIVDSIIELSLNYGVISQYTSFIAYKEESLNGGHTTGVLPPASLSYQGNFQLSINSDGLHLTLGQGYIKELEVYNLKGEKLFAHAGNKERDLDIKTADASQLFTQQGTLILKVKTDRGMIYHSFNLSRIR